MLRRLFTNIVFLTKHIETEFKISPLGISVKRHLNRKTLAKWYCIVFF